MNWLVLISGLFALSAVIGHFTMGNQSFLKPMMDASFDEVPKKVMQSVFHYISVFLVLSAVVLILVGFGFIFNLSSNLLVRFIALNYLLFALVQLIIALKSSIPRPLTKLFQWGLWIVIAIFAWLGA
ncbi:hypothetical protein ACFLU1_06610 [Chloroflexota bacterium]